MEGGQVVDPKQYSVHCCLRNYVEPIIFVSGSLFIGSG